MAQEVEIFFKVDGLETYITDLNDLEKVLNEVKGATDATAAATKDLEKDIDDASKAAERSEQRLMAMEGGVKTLAGSFEILAGSAALLGLEDNEFFGALEKNVIGILALSQGVIDASEGIKLLSQNTKIAAAAQRVFNAVANANPYVLLATAVITLAGALAAFSLATDNSTEASEDNTEALEEQNKALQTQIEREEKLAQLRGEDIFEVRYARAEKAVETLKNQQEELNKKLEETGTAFREIPIDILDPTKGTIKIYDADAVQSELDDVERRLREAEAEFAIIQEEADARAAGERKRQREKDEADALAEAEKQRLAKIALEDELYLLTLDAQDREETIAMQAFDTRVAIAGDDEGLIKAAEEQLQRDLQEIRDRYAQEEKDKKAEQLETLKEQEKQFKEELIKAEEDLQTAKVNAARAGFQVLTALAGENENAQKAIFVASQAFEAAQIAIQGTRDITQVKSEQVKNNAQLGGLLTTLTARAAAGDPFAAAAIIPVQGSIAAMNAGAAASIAGIKINTAAGIAGVLAATIGQIRGAKDTGGVQQSFGGVSAASPIAALPSYSTTQGEDIILGEPRSQQQGGGPIQAYVIASDVTTAQQANQQIENLSRL